MAAISDSVAKAAEQFRSARVQSLGLDPATEVSGHPRMLTTRSLDEITAWAAIPPPAKAKRNTMTVARAKRVSDASFRKAVIEHIFGLNPIKDPKVKSALEQRAGNFHVLVSTAPNITVTAADPLLITSTSSITVYGTVTIKDGGYIKITVPCHFQCQAMIKEQGAQTTTEYDITVTGNDGKDAPDLGTAAQGPTGTAGGNAECDCCGGTVAHSSSPGGSGGPGVAGTSADSGTSGSPGPVVQISIASLTGTVSLLNTGGRGGNGGKGENGGKGGTGGKGGDGRTCGAYHPSGSNGGAGGKGGNGGNGGSGRNGGTGATTTVSYAAANQSSSVIGVNLQAPGGTKGAGGAVGVAGVGGAGGSHGGSQGAQGHPGDTPGLDGQPGNPGAAGTLTINNTAVPPTPPQ